MQKRAKAEICAKLRNHCRQLTSVSPSQIVACPCLFSNATVFGKASEISRGDTQSSGRMACHGSSS